MNFIQLPDLCRKVGLGKSAIHDKISQSTFPAPVKLGRRSVWLESEIEQWMADRIAARDTSLAAGAAK